jgi:4-amino-4-deoxy-L-arabinose transferase
LVVIQLFDSPIPRLFNRLETYKWVIAVNGLLIWAFFLLLAVRRKGAWQKIVFFCAAPLVFLFNSHFIYPAIGREGRAPENFLVDHIPEIKTVSILISDGYCATALGWFYNRNDILLLESKGEFEYGLSYPYAQERWLSFKRFKKVVKKTSGKKTIILVLDTDRYLKFLPYLPRPSFVKTGDGFVMAGF